MTKYLDQPERGDEPAEAPTVDNVADAALAEFIRRGAAAADAVREAIDAAMGDGLEPSYGPDSFTGDISELALVLGGSADSWTGAALRLIAKSDPMHRAALLRGIPVHVLAWEAWMNAPDPRAGIRAARDIVTILNRVSAGAYGTGRLL